MTRTGLLAAPALAGLMAAALASVSAAHDGVVHVTPGEAAAHAAAKPSPPLPEGVAAFPTGIGGPYELIDQNGRRRTERDPEGRAQLIFFGYANCPSICGVALPRMTETADLLTEKGFAVRPILITVDPERDTPEAMRLALPKRHPRLIGLTGSDAALARARAAFQVEAKRLGEDPDGHPIYAHGSFVYLMDAEGGFLTLMPPVLGAERMAEIAAGYLRGE